jgi:hypothetical protein
MCCLCVCGAAALEALGVVHTIEGAGECNVEMYYNP